MRRLIAGAVVAAAALLASGCSDEPQLDHGTITDKVYEPAYTTTMTIPGTCSGSPPVCTASIMIPQYHGDHWFFRLKDERGNRGDHDVNETEYDQYKVGDMYPRH